MLWGRSNLLNLRRCLSQTEGGCPQLRIRIAFLIGLLLRFASMGLLLCRGGSQKQYLPLRFYELASACAGSTKFRNRFTPRKDVSLTE